MELKKNIEHALRRYGLAFMEVTGYGLLAFGLWKSYEYGFNSGYLQDSLNGAILVWMAGTARRVIRLEERLSSELESRSLEKPTKETPRS